MNKIKTHNEIDHSDNIVTSVMKYNSVTGDVISEYTYCPKTKKAKDKAILQSKVLAKDKDKQLLPHFKSKSRFTKLFHKMELPFAKYSYHGYMRCLEQHLEPVSNIVSELSNKTWKPLSRKQILKYINISEAELSKFLTVAKDEKVIAEVETGGIKKIIINPVYCINGTTFDYTVYSIFKECDKLQNSLTNEHREMIRQVESGL